jgi:hypothetical protein
MRIAVARAPVAAVLAVVLGGAAGALGCSHNIGDSCTYNTDCDPQGTRICDVAEPGGYCTIEGCDEQNNKCPGEAVCVRFFPTLDMTKPCLPEHEAVCIDHMPGCDPNAEAGCCRCDADEECITEGFCIRRGLEHRNCMLKCGSNGDCRGGYSCYSSGTGGAELIPSDDGGVRAAAHFCAPSLPTT